MKLSWRNLFLATLLFFILEALCFGADDLRIRAYPQMGMAPLRNVLIMVEIKAPEKFWCPSVEIEWWDGNTSKWEEDCPPLEEGEKPEDIYRSFRLGEHYAFTETQDVIVWVRQGKHSCRSIIRIIVSGG